jgi:hypothetical protein
MTASEILMAIACIAFILAGIFAYLEQPTLNLKVSIALVCIGTANALLLWEGKA